METHEINIKHYFFRHLVTFDFLVTLFKIVCMLHLKICIICNNVRKFDGFGHKKVVVVLYCIKYQFHHMNSHFFVHHLL